MARMKLAYIGGGSTRAPGTMASLIKQGDNFAGSEVVLVDLDEERLRIVKAIAEKMANDRGIDLKVTATTDRLAALRDCDAVLTSFRPGNFEMRYLDESLPLRHGIIGQETQGPGGFFMAMRSIDEIRRIVSEMEAVCPNAWLFNYTNPINLVSEAVSRHSSIKMVSLCEGPIIFPAMVMRTAGLDDGDLDSVMVGLNHACWSVRHLYKGQDVMPLLAEAYDRIKNDAAANPLGLRMLKLAVMMNALPSTYFQYYYFREEVLAELQSRPMTRSQEIMASVQDYWQHYREQAASEHPELDPARSRGGINELELAFDVMDALFNDKGEVWTCNVVNRGALADFPDDRVVEVPCYVDRSGIAPIAHGHMPKQVVGLVQLLGEYQSLAAEAAWNGTRMDGIRALASHPLVPTLAKAEKLYDEMAAAMKNYIPGRLLA